MYLSYKSDVLNNFIALGALFFVFIHILLFLLLMNQDVLLQPFFVPLWLLVLGIPMLLPGILIFISTTIVFYYKKIKNKDLSEFSTKLEGKRKSWSKAKKDSLRKINHVFIFIGLLAIWYVGLYIVYLITASSSGMIPEENNMFLQYLKLVNEPDSIIDVLFSFGWFYYLLFFFFYLLCMFILANEFTRKLKKIYFPFNMFTKLYLTEKEQDSYGSYLYFAIGQMFAAFICPPMIVFAILGIGSISDLITSQIGIRYGKIHISWNKRKTWEGTIAGTLATFLICLFFIGILWSIIFSTLYLIFDVVTDKPFKISDNLLIPIGCSIVYIFTRFFFNLDYFTVLLAWIP
jgi:dolichol kinase